MKVNALSSSLSLTHIIQNKTITCLELKTTTLAVGVIFLLAGTLALYVTAGMHLLGTTILSSFTILSSALIELTPRKKCHDQKISSTKVKTVKKEVVDESVFGNLPLEALYLILDRCDVPDLLKFKETSTAISQKISSYLAHRFPIESYYLSDYGYLLIEEKDTPQSHIELILELRERSSKGGLKNITDARFKEILNYLKENKLLYLLNATFRKEDDNTCDAGVIRNVFTPLQYWAFQGKLEYVKLLVECGAKDYLVNSPYNCRSALYQAAAWGHIEVVKYLLRSGAHSGINFNNNILHGFIPDLIYYCSWMGIYESPQMDCLRIILDYAAIYHPKTLISQLATPISPISHRNPREKNCLDWSLCRDYRPYAKAAHEILKLYGAKEGKILSIERPIDEYLEHPNGFLK